MNRINFNDGKICTIIGFWINFFLIIIKFVAGIVGKSQAMIADSLHSLSDGIATIAVYLGISISEKPADEEHPYGHGNIEVIVALFVSVLLLITGMFLGYTAIHSMMHRHFSVPGKIAVYVAIISIFVKEILYRYTIMVGKNLNSPAIIANSYDHRSDAFSSIGALLAILGARLGIKYLDPLGGVIISIFILKMGIEIITSNLKIVMDSAPDKNMQTQINNKIMNTKGVKTASTVKIHPVGRNYFLEVSITVDKNITVKDGHNIAEKIKDVLMNMQPEIKDVTVHVEPD